MAMNMCISDSYSCYRQQHLWVRQTLSTRSPLVRRAFGGARRQRPTTLVHYDTPYIDVEAGYRRVHATVMGVGTYINQYNVVQKRY